MAQTETETETTESKKQPNILLKTVNRMFALYNTNTPPQTQGEGFLRTKSYTSSLHLRS